MARSLGFAAYRALSRRLSRPAQGVAYPRPDGQVLWLHATSAQRLLTLYELGNRIRNLRDDLVVLITSGSELNSLPALFLDPDEFWIQSDRIASDHPSEVHQFLDHWRPDICLWAGATLMPNLISQAADRGMPMILADVDHDDFASRKHKWFPDLTRQSLVRFGTILTTEPTVTAMLRRFGVPDRLIITAEPLRNGPSPLPVDEKSLSTTSQQLTGRPLWLAAHVQTNEFEPVLAAHSYALRLVHRLLMVITVADPDTLNRLDDTLAGTGIRYARWYGGDDIDDNTQVLISDGIDDLGLWYRMAPLTFMGSSLSMGNGGRNPLEAVALGSAILFGPHVTDHRATYSRLATVGAGRSIGDADGLGAAVIKLVAPDHSAAMALAGWQVVTEGARLTDQLVDLVQNHLDGQAPGHARP